ncbi:MAG: hypothetical protein IJO21_07480 [Oscillospiraceae bacterium]|nr:hypothetical protein [Oscillospiraceae bacterium]MBQ7130859.1 hypothetical protein [Oscillospiraceae bacterium]
MDTLTYIVAVALAAVYGIAGVLAVVWQERISFVLVAAAVALVIGVLLYPYLQAIATVIAWIIAIALLIWLLGVFFG